MALFESRNVLDRIETTWNRFFSPDWRVTILPQILITLLGTCTGLMPIYPLFRSIVSISELSPMGDITAYPLAFGQIIISILLIVVILTVTSGLAYTYTLSICHDYEEWQSWQYYGHLAWSRLWGWMLYGLWVSLISIVLIGIAISLFFVSSTAFAFSLAILIGVLCWGMIALFAGAPGYILENSGKLSSFLRLFSITSGRWWRVCGNMFLGSIVVGSVLSLIQQFLIWVMGIQGVLSRFSGLEDQSDIDWASIFGDLSSLFWIRFFIGGILLFILSASQQVFVTMFQYTVWQEITTDVDAKVSE